MADLKFYCPECRQKIAVDTSDIGRELDCPRCKSSLLIPATPELPVQVMVSRGGAGPKPSGDVLGGGKATMVGKPMPISGGPTPIPTIKPPVATSPGPGLATKVPLPSAPGGMVRVPGAPVKMPLAGTPGVPVKAPVAGTPGVPVKAPVAGAPGVPVKAPVAGPPGAPVKVPVAGPPGAPVKVPVAGPPGVPMKTPVAGAPGVPMRAPVAGAPGVPIKAPVAAAVPVAVSQPAVNLETETALRGQLETEQQKVQSLEQDLAASQAERVRIEGTHEQAKAQWSELESAAQGREDLLKEQLASAQSQLGTLTESVKLAEDRANALQQKKEELESELVALRGRSDLLPELEAKIEGFDARLKEGDAEQERLRTAAHEMIRELAESKRELTESKRELGEVRLILESSQRELEVEKKKVIEVGAKFAASELERVALHVARGEVPNPSAEAVEEIRELKARLTDMQINLDAIRRERDRLRRQIQINPADGAEAVEDPTGGNWVPIEKIVPANYAGSQPPAN